MTSAASPSSPHVVAAFEAGGDYFATETHYQSIARRIIGALRGGGSFVLVTGDPPASPQLLSQALGRSTASSHAVINFRCGPELTPEAVRRAGSVITRLPANSGAVPAPEPLEPAAPLFVFDDLDQLSDRQIKEICEAAQNGDRPGAAGVLLAGPGFLSRLEGRALQFLRGALAGEFRFQDVGQDEGLDFLRHQLANRHRIAEVRRAPRGLIRAITALALLALLAAGIAAFLALRFMEGGGDRPVPSATGSSSTREASTPQPEPNAMPSAPPPATLQPARVPEAAPHHSAISTKPISLQPARVPEAAPPRAAPAPAQLPVTPPAPSPPPAESPAARPVSPAEIAALVARGDSFLGAGDIASARLFYERAADAADGPAALRLGATFDPGFLGRASIRGIPGDPEQAAYWYRRARDLGEAAAADRLKSLEEYRPAEPDAPAAQHGAGASVAVPGRLDPAARMR
jgi:hypothetical protein